MFYVKRHQFCFKPCNIQHTSMKGGLLMWSPKVDHLTSGAVFTAVIFWTVNMYQSLFPWHVLFQLSPQGILLLNVKVMLFKSLYVAVEELHEVLLCVLHRFLKRHLDSCLFSLFLFHPSPSLLLPTDWASQPESSDFCAIYTCRCLVQRLLDWQPKKGKDDRKRNMIFFVLDFPLKIFYEYFAVYPPETCTAFWPFSLSGSGKLGPLLSSLFLRSNCVILSFSNS